MENLKDLSEMTDAEWEAVFLAACEIYEDPNVDKWAALDAALEKSAELAR
jgi:hypothetical protein